MIKWLSDDTLPWSWAVAESWTHNHSVFHFQFSIHYLTWDIQHYYKIGFVLDDFAQL